MFIGYLHCQHCGYRTEEFMCMYHHWRDGYHVPVQDRDTLAIRLIHVPEDDVFYADDDSVGPSREQKVEQYVAGVLDRSRADTEQAVPIFDLLQESESTSVPCPACRAGLAWETTGIT